MKLQNNLHLKLRIIFLICLKDIFIKKIHVHSFVVEVTFYGKKNKENQWVTDFDELSKSLNEIKKKLDHKCINDIKEIGLPTLENISSWIGKQLKKKYSNVRSIKLSRPSCGESCVYNVS